MKFRWQKHSEQPLPHRKPLMDTRVCIGVDLTGSRTGAVRVERGRSGRLSVRECSITVATSKNIPVAGCISVSDSLTVWLDAPFDSWSKNRRVAPALLDAKLPFPLEDCLFDLPAARRNKEGVNQTLAVAIRRNRAEECLAKHKEVGIDPVFMDHAGLAIWTQSVLEWPLPRHEIRAMIQVQPDAITLALGSGADFEQAHTLRMPLQPDAITLQIDRILFAAFGNDCRANFGLCAGENSDLTMELERNILARHPGRPVWKPETAELFLPRALATRALTTGPLRCNLRSGELTHPVLLNRQNKVMRRIAGMVCVAGLALIAGNWRLQSEINHRRDNLRREISALAAQMAPDTRIPYGREVVEALRALETEKEEDAPLRALLAADLPGKIGRLTSAAADADIVIDSLQADKSKFTFTGVAADWTACENLKRKIELSGYKCQLESLPALDDGRAVFNAKGSWS